MRTFFRSRLPVQGVVQKTGVIHLVHESPSSVSSARALSGSTRSRASSCHELCMHASWERCVCVQVCVCRCVCAGVWRTVSEPSACISGGEEKENFSLSVWRSIRSPALHLTETCFRKYKKRAETSVFPLKQNKKQQRAELGEDRSVFSKGDDVDLMHHNGMKLANSEMENFLERLLAFSSFWRRKTYESQSSCGSPGVVKNVEFLKIYRSCLVDANFAFFLSFPCVVFTLWWFSHTSHVLVLNELHVLWRTS